MKIGVVSDTHMPSRAKKLPEALLHGLDGVDLIIHAGDWVTLDVVKMFENIAPVESVAGNNDGSDIVERFGYKKILTFDEYRIGLIHGDGHGKTTEQRAFHTFAGESTDMIIFGHSHIPLNMKHGEIILLNPGSPTDKRRQRHYSYGIVTLSDTLEARLFYYDERV